MKRREFLKKAGTGRGRGRDLSVPGAGGMGFAAGRDGVALGTGNTVANYIPVDSYLTMVDESHLYGA